MSEGFNEQSSVVRRHIDAFNARDLEALVACFSTDATWITGTDAFQGSAAYPELFGVAFAELSPQLHLRNLVAQDDVVACELREHSVGGVEHTDHVGLLRHLVPVADHRREIYREGLADVA